MAEAQLVELTNKAVEKVLSIAKTEGFDPCIRAGVKGGGCAGYRYDLFFEEKDDISDTDHTFDFDGVTLVVDMMSATYLEGTTIDFVEGLMGAGFKFSNPKITATCGCGSSFNA